ncbi:DUF4307 domain-containing protein [Mycolicibacterium pulveris]|uniref:DUF4307 domain-containing protein n=1 Tax=Mycolicibacterium pulveris TaxID=36813 RepID=UPI003CEF60F0
MIERPAARYGRQRLSGRQRRWVAIGLTVATVIAGVVLAVIAYQRFASEDVKGEIGSFEVIDDSSVSVTITVTRKDPSQPAVCIVRARSYDGSETGRREVLVAPSTHPAVQVTTVVKTSQPPVVGDVYGCGTDVPSYLVTP